MINTNEMLILQGLPGAGKSTLAKKYVEDNPNYLRICWDDIGRANPGMKFDKVKALSHGMVAKAKQHGMDVVIDNTNLTVKTYQEWERIGQENLFTVRYQYVETPIEECIRRDSERTQGRVGRAVIERMALKAGLLKLGGKPVVVYDMDGTLASCQGRVHHIKGERKDHKAFYKDVHLDPEIKPVADWARAVGAAGEHTIVILSGRPTDLAGINTERWLAEHNIVYSHLFMRSRADFRADHIIKNEIVDEMLQAGAEIAWAVDDRVQVIENVWRARKVTVYPVGTWEPEF